MELVDIEEDLRAGTRWAYDTGGGLCVALASKAFGLETKRKISSDNPSCHFEPVGSVKGSPSMVDTSRMKTARIC